MPGGSKCGPPIMLNNKPIVYQLVATTYNNLIPIFHAKVNFITIQIILDKLKRIYLSYTSSVF